MKQRRILTIFLWIAQVLLAFMFVSAGITKLTNSIEALVLTMSWVQDFPVLFVRFVGFSELLGGLGMLLPYFLRWKTHLLISLAALGLAIVMLSALVYHVIKGEYNALGFNIILGSIALFVAWGHIKTMSKSSSTK